MPTHQHSERPDGHQPTPTRPTGRRRKHRLPSIHTDIDPIAVERACDGDQTVTLSRAEMTAAWRELERRRLSAQRIADVLGTTRRTVERWRQGQNQPVSRRTIGVLAERRGLAAQAA